MTLTESPHAGAGWWAESGAWVPRDWALRPGYDTRVAIINALYACGENVQRLMPIMVAEAVRRDRSARTSCNAHCVFYCGVHRWGNAGSWGMCAAIGQHVTGIPPAIRSA